MEALHTTKHRTPKLVWTSNQTALDTNGREWKVSYEIYHKFRFTGFPAIPKDKEIIIFDLFSRITDKTKQETIKQILEVFMNIPAEDIFASLET